MLQKYDPIPSIYSCTCLQSLKKKKKKVFLTRTRHRSGVFCMKGLRGLSLNRRIPNRLGLIRGNKCNALSTTDAIQLAVVCLQSFTSLWSCQLSRLRFSAPSVSPGLESGFWSVTFTTAQAVFLLEVCPSGRQKQEETECWKGKGKSFSFSSSSTVVIQDLAAHVTLFHHGFDSVQVQSVNQACVL